MRLLLMLVTKISAKTKIRSKEISLMTTTYRIDKNGVLRTDHPDGIINCPYRDQYCNDSCRLFRIFEEKDGKRYAWCLASPNAEDSAVLIERFDMGD